MLGLDVLYLATGFALLVTGAELFVRGGCGFALKFKIPEYVVGATIIALGTSLPEGFISFYAAWRGNPAISVSNVIGSNVFNIAMVLGITALMKPISIKRDVFTTDSPPFLLSPVVLFLLIMAGGAITRFGGVVLVLLLVAYIWLVLKEREEPDEGLRKLAPRSTLLMVVFLVAAVIALYFGSRLAVESAVNIARRARVSEWIIGVSVVALGTSLPELITSAVAALRGRHQMAVGNIIGSNIFNIYFVLGVSALISPLAVSSKVAMFDIPFVFALSLILLFIVSDRRMSRQTGFSLILTYIAFLVASIAVHGR
jgi:cation:H+ antiporter